MQGLSPSIRPAAQAPLCSTSRIWARLEIADAAAFERSCRAIFSGSGRGGSVYTLLLNEAGGIIDDLMVANLGSR